jgi:TolB protein
MQLNRSFSGRLVLGLAVVAGLSGLAQPARAQAAGGDDVIEVGGAVRSLPRVQIVPDDAASVDAATSLGKMITSTALYVADVRKPGDTVGGLAVRIGATKDGAKTRLTAKTTRADSQTRQRSVAFDPAAAAPSPTAAPPRDLEAARLADAVIEDLSGTRSHLSGQILFTDAGTPGERRVVVMLGSGVPIRIASPSGVLARGAGLGIGDVVHYAAAAEGQMLRIFAEGRKEPLAIKVPGYLQSVAFTPDRTKAALIAGNVEGGALYAGNLEGTMTLVDTGPGIAIGPTFGDKGELAWAAGPAAGPLRVFVDGKPVSQAGAWATAPSFCNREGKGRVAYMVKNGSSNSIVVSDLGGGSHTAGVGSYPACSPDGRTIAASRPGRGKASGGVYFLGDDGVAAVRVRDGEAAGLRWVAGPPLPPEGLFHSLDDAGPSNAGPAPPASLA